MRLKNNSVVTSFDNSSRTLVQYIEAQNVAGSGWNYTSTSSYVTLSFWVRSSVAQNFYGFVRSHDGTSQSYPFETGSLTADTWTKITKTIPGDADVAIDNNNGVGIELSISAYLPTANTDPSVTLDAWMTRDSSQRTPDFTQTWASTANATFDITGVQLEVGSVATPFEHRSYGDELARCQRYYQLFDSAAGEAYPTGGVGAYAICGVNFIQTMRAAPTVTLGTAGTSTNTSGDNFSLTTPTAIGCVYGVVQGAGGGNYYKQRTSNTASAEL
jgi:hypothetical protein